MKRGMKDYVTPGMAVVEQQPAMSLFSGSGEPIPSDDTIVVPKPGDSFSGDESVAAPVWGCRWDVEDPSGIRTTTDAISSFCPK